MGRGTRCQTTSQSDWRSPLLHLGIHHQHHLILTIIIMVLNITTTIIIIIIIIICLASPLLCPGPECCKASMQTSQGGQKLPTLSL